MGLVTYTPHTIADLILTDISRIVEAFYSFFNLMI